MRRFASYTHVQRYIAGLLDTLSGRSLVASFAESQLEWSLKSGYSS